MIRHKERPGVVRIPFELGEVVIDFRSEFPSNIPRVKVLVSRNNGKVLQSKSSGQPILISRVTA
jgi:hypothetical protein